MQRTRMSLLSPDWRPSNKVPASIFEHGMTDCGDLTGLKQPGGCRCRNGSPFGVSSNRSAGCAKTSVRNWRNVLVGRKQPDRLSGRSKPLIREMFEARVSGSRFRRNKMWLKRPWF